MMSKIFLIARKTNFFMTPGFRPGGTGANQNKNGPRLESVGGFTMRIPPFVNVERGEERSTTRDLIRDQEVSNKYSLISHSNDCSIACCPFANASTN